MGPMDPGPGAKGGGAGGLPALGLREQGLGFFDPRGAGAGLAFGAPGWEFSLMPDTKGIPKKLKPREAIASGVKVLSCKFPDEVINPDEIRKMNKDEMIKWLKKNSKT